MSMGVESRSASSDRVDGSTALPASHRSALAVVAVGVLVVVTACQVPVALPGAPSCPVTPANSYWHANVSKLPVNTHSATYLATEGAGSPLHADFGSGTWDGGPIGIPYTTVSGTQAKVKITFDGSPDESDPGPYPIPANAPIEGGSAVDR